VCFFARGIYDSDTISNAFEAIGIVSDEPSMFKLGSEIVKKKLEFKCREGFSPEKFKIPNRVLETESPHGKINEDYIRDTIKAYYSLANF
jgi:aldehyde:ferredoxin oxidoreductase